MVISIGKYTIYTFTKIHQGCIGILISLPRFGRRIVRPRRRGAGHGAARGAAESVGAALGAAAAEPGRVEVKHGGDRQLMAADLGMYYDAFCSTLLY